MPRTSLDSISRLPESARAEISRAVADGRTWRQVAKLCEGHGLKGVTAQNVTNFRQSNAHKRWVLKEERIAAIKAEQENGREIFEAAQGMGMNPAEAGCFVASRKLLEMIEGLDMKILDEASADDPRILIEVMKAATQLAKSLRSVKAPASREPSAKTARQPGELNDDERAAIVAKVDEVLGIKTKR